MIDLAIIGSGPAALTAAIYAARAALDVKVFERKSYGGILAEIPLIENYPGFIGSGTELAEKMRAQAMQFGVKFDYGECSQLNKLNDRFELSIDEAKIDAKTVLVATGSKPKELSFSLNIPVSYCALCDGALAKGKNVVVVGGANSAVQEALYLSKIANQVTVITHSSFKADPILLSRLKNCHNIKTQENIEPTAKMLNQFDYCFVYIGKQPATDFLRSYDILDQEGYVICSDYSNQTKIPGLFAAGDIRAHSIKQVVTAAADGAAAAIEITQEYFR